jgi:hypothetical protein
MIPGQCWVKQSPIDLVRELLMIMNKPTLVTVIYAGVLFMVARCIAAVNIFKPATRSPNDSISRNRNIFYDLYS